MFAHHRSAVQHSRHAHIVNEGSVAHRLLDSVVARRRLPDAILFRGCSATQTVLFAEIEMPARFGRRQTLALIAIDLVPGFTGGLYRVQYARVTGAAAQMAIESLGNR